MGFSMMMKKKAYSFPIWTRRVYSAGSNSGSGSVRKLWSPFWIYTLQKEIAEIVIALQELKKSMKKLKTGGVIIHEKLKKRRSCLHPSRNRIKKGSGLLIFDLVGKAEVLYWIMGPTDKDGTPLPRSEDTILHNLEV